MKIEIISYGVFLFLAPDKPTKVEAVNKTSSSVVVTWGIGDFPKGKTRYTIKIYDEVDKKYLTKEVTVDGMIKC